MAEAFLSFLLTNLGQLIKQEASLFQGVEGVVKSLHDELKLINNFLENSKEKRDMVKDLVYQIHNVANKANDVVEMFVISTTKHKKRNVFEKILHGSQHVAMLRRAALEVKKVNEDISTIYANKDRYGISETGSGDDDSNRLSTVVDRLRKRVTEEHYVVGLENDSATLIRKLSQGSRDLCVVSIMGMGGLGKSTLARKIYNHDFIEQHFDCRIWIYVSRESQSRQVLVDILQKATAITNSEISEMGSDDEKLVEHVRNCLKEKKYLIVLDSLWEASVWDEVKSAFPDNGKGCRVMVTTRNKEVALCTISNNPNSEDYPHFLPFLNKEDSWHLFKRRAFGGKCCPPELETAGKMIVEKCRGLPVAIVAAVDHLAKKEKLCRTWSKMANNLSLYFTCELKYCLDILALSYEEIPKDHRGLRYCFLYFGLFLEYSEISARQLVRLWVAEGFLEKEKGLKMEEIAEDYLEQLVDMNLIMVVKRRSDGGIKSCYIHDLLRIFCIHKGVQENLFTIHNEDIFDSPANNITTANPRRLSVQCKASRYISSISSINTSMVHSLLYFGDKDTLNTSKICLIYQAFKRLRVLDLGSTIVSSVPTQVKNLIHLRYLKMDSPALTKIPSAISGLPKLQTLDLRKSRVTFTANFWKMQQLRNIFISEASCLPSLLSQSDGKTMTNLQTFSIVNPQILNALNFDSVFPNVKKLGLHSTKKNPVSTDISKFKSVQTLKIINSSFYSTSNSRSILYRLTKITLIENKLTSTDFALLADVPNLEVLKLLRNSVFETNICITQVGFLKLQLLHMEELSVQKLTMESGALKNLQKLFIIKCLRLTQVPEQMKYLSAFKHVKAKPCSIELKKSLLSLGEHILYEL